MRISIGDSATGRGGVVGSGKSDRELRLFFLRTGSLCGVVGASRIEPSTELSSCALPGRRILSSDKKAPYNVGRSRVVGRKSSASLESVSVDFERNSCDLTSGSPLFLVLLKVRIRELTLLSPSERDEFSRCRPKPSLLRKDEAFDPTDPV